MGMKYIPDELIIRIAHTGIDSGQYIRESIEEKLERDKVE